MPDLHAGQHVSVLRLSMTAAILFGSRELVKNFRQAPLFCRL